MKKLRVLSIDFDFFQDVDKDTLCECYPDGIDLSTDLSCIVWASRYANDLDERLKQVSINKHLLDDLYDILYFQSPNVPVLVCQSHVNIYYFIEELMKEDIEQKLYIVNIDMHHDCFNDNPEVDCGNWISHIHNNYPNVILSWIAREVSLEAYKLSAKELPVETILDKIKDAEFDVIFICRSDAWLPPHLDKNFDDLLHNCRTYFKNLAVEECVQVPRNISKIFEAKNKIKEDTKRCIYANDNSTSKS